MSAQAQSVTFAWDPPDGPAPAGYRLRYGPTGGPPSSEKNVGAAETATISGLGPGTSYDFHVVAYDGAGLVSAPSNVVRYTVPGDPSGGGTDDGGGGGGGGGDGTVLGERAYLAEGVQSSFFSTSLDVANPTTSWAAARLVLKGDDGEARAVRLEVPPLGHATAEAAQILDGEGAFGIAMDSSVPLGLSRLTTWGQASGGHSELATRQPARRWYFAEGSTAAPFELFYLILNPGDSYALVNVTYIRPSGSPLKKRYKVAPQGRLTIWVDQEAADLASTDVAAVIESVDGPAIVAERAMYLAGPKGFSGGHVSLGIDAPRSRWLMAEGATGSFFNLFVLLANPSTTPADVMVTFRRPDGIGVRHKVRLQPMQRQTIDVAALDPLLRDTAVWTDVRVANDVKIVAERVMWWPGTTWSDGHVASAAKNPAARWLAVGGRSGGTQSHATYVLLANVASSAQKVRVSVLGASGRVAEKTVTVPAGSRFNVDMSAMFPGVTGTYSVLVEAVSGADVLVVEQSMYWDALGQHWAAGAASPALALDQ